MLLLCTTFTTLIFAIIPVTSTFLAVIGVLASFIIGNFIEYSVHRWFMHKKQPGFGWLYRKHAREHHVFFDFDNMKAHNSRDYYFLLFPWWAVPLVLLAGACAIMSVMYLFLPLSFVAGYGIGISIYYFLYEICHTLTHQSHTFGNSIGWPHKVHHCHKLMHSSNFNIVLPLFDWIFGTYEHSPP